MSLVTVGLAAELKKDGVAVNSLWPRTTIDTAAIRNVVGAELADRSRTPEIMADAAYAILTKPSGEATGNFFLDDEVLRAAGVTDFCEVPHRRLGGGPPARLLGRPGLTGVREPQQERSRTTRRRLIEAALDSFGERGWHGVTVAVIAERAGVSRGAAQHHFPTREDLVAAAVDLLGEAQIDELRAQAADLPSGSSRIERVVEMVLNLYTGPLFRAALQLWAVAATDEALRDVLVPLEARVGREAHRVTVELLGVDEARPGVRELVQATLDLARGLGLANLLTDDTRRRRQIVREWARSLELRLAGTGEV